MTENEKATIGKAIRIKCYEIAYQEIRFVTWNAITDGDVDDAITKVTYVNAELEKKLTSYS